MSEGARATDRAGGWRLLVVDDKPNFRGLLRKVLAPLGPVHGAAGVREAREALAAERFDAVLCDLRMPDGDGLEVLRALRASGSRAPFVLMTAYATVPTAVQAMREGAYDYVTKPFDPAHVRALLERALREAAEAPGEPEPASLPVAARDAPAPAPAAASASSAGPKPPRAFGRLLGASEPMLALYKLLERVAPTDATVLVLGETGTGKELVARELHARSSRAARPFVALNCAAIPRALLESELFGYAKGSFTGAASDRAGLFEEADRSTLLLDELGELRPTLQAKLTRVLEERAVRRLGEARERPVDVRLVAATHRDLPALVRSGEFREDLWYRLNVCVLRVPPLRERGDDVLLLAEHFLAARGERGRRRGFSEAAKALLRAHRWPGNVRELRSAVERAAILDEGDEIAASSLPDELRAAAGREPGASLDEGARAALGASERGGRRLDEMSYREAAETVRDAGVARYLAAVLTKSRGNVTDAAAVAGVERPSFHRLLKRHGLRAEDFRAGAARPAGDEAAVDDERDAADETDDLE